MVNKQYHIHNPKLNKNSSKKYSPPPLRSFPIISSQPNPIAAAVGGAGSGLSSFTGATGSITPTNNLDNLNEELKGNKLQANNYERNLTYFADNNNRGGAVLDGDQDDTNLMCSNVKNDNYNNDDGSLSAKDVSISDFGRFQYIVQMDKEMGTHPDSLYRIPSRPQSSLNTNSTSNSINSNHHTHFWKAGGSQSPITSSSSTSSFSFRQKRYQMYRLWKIFWRYAKWPLGLLLVCGLLGLIVYFLVVGTQNTSSSESLISNSDYSIDEKLEIDFNEFNDNGLDPTHTPHDDRGSTPEEPDLPAEKSNINLLNTLTNNNDILEIFVKNPFDLEGFPGTTSTENYFDDETPAIVERITEKGMTKVKTEKKIIPTQETLRTFGFTSGHQNNFGIPIEEDERILRMLNDQLINFDRNTKVNETTYLTTSTDSSLFRTKVSPTLPIISKYDITTESGTKNQSDEGTCISTGLALCRGVMPYDLTISSKKKLSALEYHHFQYLLSSECSARVSEFVCAVLEPECRPTRMGTLEPCKRICKSVLEPCAHIIASSEVLTSTFDCDSYPDSNDRNVCEDPSRRGKCFGNEYKCLDSSCIPLQWKCDNIKDCADGEDENNCKFCEREEFRCQSDDKCIPDKWRCDGYDDCQDESDEQDCYEDDSRTFPPNYGNDRIYPYAQVQAPNSPNNRPYLTITGEDRINSAENKKSGYAYVDDDKEYISTGAENVDVVKKNDTEQSEEIQTKEESGRTILVSKSITNFQDSKEIMMTSDSEREYSYTSTSTARSTASSTAHVSPCPDGELRCVDGVCITLEQLCDKTTDCSDGADEAMCVYKD